MSQIADNSYSGLIDIRHAPVIVKRVIELWELTMHFGDRPLAVVAIV